MANRMQGRPKSKSDEQTDPYLDPTSDKDPLDEDGSSFAWEFVNDEHQGNSPAASARVTSGSPPLPRQRSGDDRHTASAGASPQQSNPTDAGTRGRAAQRRRPAPTVVPTGGRFGSARANYVRDQLDRALDRWWAQAELPPLTLLRDGLLLLEAGGSATESQRTLLLRAALAYDRGIQTALRHQADAERVALVLGEALVEWDVPLAPEQLPAILGDDEQVQAALVTELERSRVLLAGEPRRRAQVALEMLLRPARKIPRPVPPPVLPPVLPDVATNAPVARRPFRQILFILLLIALLGFVLWQQRRSTTPRDMVAMPAASYHLLGADGAIAAEPVQLDAFFVDRFEVTNRDYRTCVERGACLWPVVTASATRADYFTNPAFDRYPVVNVTQSMGASYCSWQEKRLPTAGEWQAAASVAPTTGQQFRFPWGESFDPQRANSRMSGFGDALMVGSFQPGGNSPSGAADMAGNVAEWTSTLVPGPEASTSYAVVKGGSYTSTAEALAVAAELHVEVGSTMPELGFRCARTRLPG